MSIPVGSVFFGEIDAKNEVFQQTRQGISVFQNSFQVPPGINVDQLISGAKFFITGQKGCGKTALLLHVKDILGKMGAETTILLFKSGISESERQQIASGKDIQLIEQDGVFATQYDYELNWLWYIYRNLLRKINKDSVISGWEIAESLKRLIGVDNELNTFALSDLQTKSINAGAKAGVKAGPFSAEVSADVEMVRDVEPQRLAVSIIEIIERHIGKIKLKVKSRKVLIFDELELFWNKADQRERDLFLIRDLIKSVARVNRVVGSTSASMTVIAAIRSEVLFEVNRVGPEISRDVEDCGVRINWNVRADDRSQPILKIVEAKISQSEIEADELPSEDPWAAYFPRKIFRRETQKYLLDISMFKPRNIVNLLNLAKEYDFNSHSFSIDALDEAQAQFSKRTWREIEEELLGQYSGQEVSAIKSILSAYRERFNISELENRIKTLSNIDGRVGFFCQRPNLIMLLESLYRVGAIGNDYELSRSRRRNGNDHRYRWAFRENPEPAFDKNFVVHESIRKELQLSFRDT